MENVMVVPVVVEDVVGVDDTVEGVVDVDDTVGNECEAVDDVVDEINTGDVLEGCQSKVHKVLSAVVDAAAAGRRWRQLLDVRRLERSNSCL